MLKNYGGGWIDRGIRAGLRSPWVSHLLFADDCLVFMKADSRSATRLNEILSAYSLGSGQSANKQKSSIFFSPKCGASVKRGVRNALQIQREALTEKYLGLPTAAGKITEQNFEHIVESARSRVQGWSFRKASCTAREVHLKSVIQALPAFSMSCFKLTKGLCCKVTSVMSKYWWAGSLDKQGMHWQSWAKMAIPKSKGGLGSETSSSLMTQCWQNRNGGYWITLGVYVRGS